MNGKKGLNGFGAKTWIGHSCTVKSYYTRISITGLVTLTIKSLDTLYTWASPHRYRKKIRDPPIAKIQTQDLRNTSRLPLSSADGMYFEVQCLCESCKISVTSRLLLHK